MFHLIMEQEGATGKLEHITRFIDQEFSHAQRRGMRGWQALEGKGSRTA